MMKPLPMLFSTLLILSSFNEEKASAPNRTPLQAKGFSEQSSSNSLQKYSYLLFGTLNKKPIGIGTCFFIKWHKRLLLISCYHNFTFWDTFKGGRRTPSPDSILVRVFRRDNNLPQFFSISIAKIKAESPMHYFYEYPDLYIYEITNPLVEKTYKINSIESFLNDGKNNGSVKNALFYGFIPLELKDSKDLLTIRSQLFEGNTVGNIDQIWYYDEIKKYDSINYQIDKASFSGVSGSPVFFRTTGHSNQAGKEEIIFGGVVFGNADQGQKTRVVKPKYLLHYLNEYK